MNYSHVRLKNIVCLFICFLSLILSIAKGDNLIFNGDIEEFENNSPKGFPVDESKGISFVKEENNSFIRLKTQEPGKMVMMYKEYNIPAGTKALELSVDCRVSDLVKGSQGWFDARIMMEFMDGGRQKVSAGIPTLNFGRNTAGWEKRTVSFLVPENAKILKFMPCLFNCKSGTFDLDNFSLKAVDDAKIKAENKAREEANRAKREQDVAKRKQKAFDKLQSKGNLVDNGDFESSSFGSSKDSVYVCEEDGNHFVRIQQKQPGKLVNRYYKIDLPANTDAMQLSWRQRVSDLKKGSKPWFDARIMFEFHDEYGNKLAGAPGPSYRQGNTKGWENRSVEFLIPTNAVSFVFMPSLFQVEAGTYDLDDFVLKSFDSQVLYERKAKQEKMEKARFVADEKPRMTKWPLELRVVGNKVLNSRGEEVWLQGVNVVGMESVARDGQVRKSAKVAIEDWKSNNIRLPIKEDFWFGRTDYQKDGGEYYRYLVDQIITFAANRGAYVVIDLHRFRAPKAEHIEFWKDVAEKYGNHPAVLFDIFNEPHGISWEIWRNGGFVSTAKGVDESAFLSEEEKRKNQGFESVGMQALVDVIRETGARNIIIAGGLFWCNDLSGIVNGYALDDKGGNGIMYSWHTYNWHRGWDRIQPVLEKYPIYLGECGGDERPMGFIPLKDQEDPFTFCPDMIAYIQKNGIHWAAFCLAPNSTPRLISDWEYTPTPFWGAFVKDALGGKKFELKRVR